MTPAKIYTRKELVMTETSSRDFHTSFYIPSTQKLAFHIKHIQIIGTNNCGKTCREAFKLCSTKQYMLCHRYYAEILVASLAHQIQSEYYRVN